jgi:hypothetical protein
MPEEENRKGGFFTFWTTLPGILTGLAALITAVVGAVALFKSTDNGGGNSEPATTIASTAGGGSTTAQGKYLATGRLMLVSGDKADLERGQIGESTDADLSFGPETTPTLHYTPPSFFAPVDARPARNDCVSALHGRRDTTEIVSAIERKWLCVSTAEANVAVVRVVSAPGVGSAKLVLGYTVWR